MMVDEGSRQHLFSCLYRFKPMFGLVIWNAVNLMTNPGPGPVRHRPKKYAKLAWFLRKVGGWRGHTDMDSSGWWQPEFFDYISFVFGQHFTHT
jgi:hypothetical protein